MNTDEWWIEWMEGDVDGETEKDLQTLIRRSVRHRKRWQQWQKLRDRLSRCEIDVGVELSAEYWKKQEKKIMSKILLTSQKGKQSART